MEKRKWKRLAIYTLLEYDKIGAKIILKQNTFFIHKNFVVRAKLRLQNIYYRLLIIEI